MKKVISTLLAVGIAAASFGRQMDPLDSHVADFRLLTDKRIQAEVNLTKKQILQMNQYADTNRSRLQAYESELKRQGKDLRTVNQNDPVVMKNYFELQKNVLSTLSAPQLKRLRELTLQRVGLRGMLDTVVATRIGLTGSQLQKARDVFDKGNRKNNEISQTVYNKVIEQYRNRQPKTQAEAQALNEQVKRDYESALSKRSGEIKQLALETRKAFESVVSKKSMSAYDVLKGKTFVPK